MSDEKALRDVEKAIRFGHRYGMSSEDFQNLFKPSSCPTCETGVPVVSRIALKDELTGNRLFIRSELYTRILEAIDQVKKKY